jgi:hypothetical protein
MTASNRRIHRRQGLWLRRRSCQRVLCAAAIVVATAGQQVQAVANDTVTTARSSTTRPAKPAQPGGKGTSTRVRFASGTSSQTISAQLIGTQTATYVIGATKGQVMTLESTPANTVLLTLVGPDRKAIAGGRDIGGFAGRLGSTGDMTVTVKLTPKRSKGNASITYRLRIAIEDIS